MSSVSPCKRSVYVKELSLAQRVNIWIAVPDEFCDLTEDTSHVSGVGSF